MKLTMTKVLTPIAALAFSFGVQAAAVSTETFDTYTAGTTVITNQTGWSFTYGTDGADDASAVTAYDNNAPSVGPDGVSAGANYLKLSTEDGILFRNMDGTATGNTVDLNAGLFVDTDVQFTITDASDRPTPTAEDKFIIWLEDQGTATNLCAYAYQFAADGTATAKVFTLAANATGDSLGIVPGNWYRLTVKAISDANAGGNSELPGFQVYLNQTLVYTTEAAASGAFFNNLSQSAQTLIAEQKFLPAMASAMTSLSKVGFSGEGAIDSVVVTRDVPAFENPVELTFNFDTTVIDSVDITALGASLTASGSTLRVYPGTFNLEINYKDGYSSATHTTTISSGNDAYATVAGFAVTAISVGTTITITTTPNDTVDVTFDWSGIVQAMIAAQKQELSAITFTVGDGAPVSGDVQNETVKTLSGLKVGTNITIAVTYSNPWTTTYGQSSESGAGTATLSFTDNVVTINTRGDGKATVTISAEEVVTPTGWVDDVTTITEGATAGEQYSTLAGTALATADAAKLTTWAKANGVAFTDATTSAGDYVEAFLLNCAPTAEAVAAEKAAFKADITVNADGTVTVTPPAGKTYNVTPQLKGATSLTGTWTAIETTTGYNFFKYELSLPAAGN